MKKLGIGLVVALALSAFAVVTGGLATDVGSNTAINHSEGVVVFPYYKLKTATSKKTIPFYTTVAAWPTTFVPQTIVWDGGDGCVKRTMVETPYTDTISGRTAGYPFNCIIDTPPAALDAGVHTVYKAGDGGYGISTCPGYDTVPTTAWSAFCYSQNGISP